MADNLINRTNFAFPGLAIWIAIEEITREPNLIADPATQELINRYAQLLSDNIQASEFQSRMELSPVIIKGSRRVTDRIAHPVKVKRVVSDQVAFQPGKG